MTEVDEKQNVEREGAEAVIEDLFGESALRAKHGGRDAVSGLTPRIRRQQQSAAAAATERNFSAAAVGEPLDAFKSFHAGFGGGLIKLAAPR